MNINSTTLIGPLPQSKKRKQVENPTSPKKKKIVASVEKSSINQLLEYAEANSFSVKFFYKHDALAQKWTVTAKLFDKNDILLFEESSVDSSKRGAKKKSAHLCYMKTLKSKNNSPNIVEHPSSSSYNNNNSLRSNDIITSMNSLLLKKMEGLTKEMSIFASFILLDSSKMNKRISILTIAMVSGSDNENSNVSVPSSKIRHPEYLKSLSPVVLARRSFLRFLYSQVYHFYLGSRSIFNYSNGKLLLNEGLSIFLIANTHSSDNKIKKWNSNGVEGALLKHFLAPIQVNVLYSDSFTDFHSSINRNNPIMVYSICDPLEIITGRSSSLLSKYALYSLFYLCCESSNLSISYPSYYHAKISGDGRWRAMKAEELFTLLRRQ